MGKHYHQLQRIRKERTGNGLEVYAQATYDFTYLPDEQQKANAKYIYNYLSRKGWSKEVICGLLGNINQESHFNPGAWQEEASNPGYGLIQSTPYKGYRKFLDWAELENSDADKMAQNEPRKLMDLQLEYLIWSSQTSTPAEVRQWFPTTKYDSPYKMSYKEYIVSTKNVGKLTLVFHGSYERSGDTEEIRQNRINYAEYWYGYFSKQ